jgi:hypothetical protein
VAGDDPAEGRCPRRNRARRKVAYLDTFDTDLHKLSGTLGDPKLTIAAPSIPGKLF